MGKATESLSAPGLSGGAAGVPRAHSRSWRWGTWRGHGVCPGTRAGSQPRSGTGLGTSARLQRRVATVTARRGRCQTTARSGQRTNACRPGENNSPAPPKQALDHRAALRRARLDGALSPPASSVGLGQRSSLWLQAGGEPRGPISGSRAAFPEQRDGGRGDGRGLVRRAGVPRAGLEGAGGEQHPAGPGHGAVGEGCPAGDRDRAGDAPGRADSVLPSAGGWEAEPRVPPPATGSPQGQQHGPGPPSPAQQWGCSGGAERTERNPISAAALPGTGAPIALFMSIRNSIKASYLIVFFLFQERCRCVAPSPPPHTAGSCLCAGAGGLGGPCTACGAVIGLDNLNQGG